MTPSEMILTGFCILSRSDSEYKIVGLGIQRLAANSRFRFRLTANLCFGISVF
jgi:hypothetical protein